jgi:hypothetical protein
MASHSIHCRPAQGLIKFGDKEFGPYHSQAEAMLFATDAAQKLGEQGENTQVGSMGEHGRFRPEWSYGKDLIRRRDYRELLAVDWWRG